MVPSDVNARLAAVELVSTSLRRFHDCALRNVDDASRTVRDAVAQFSVEHDRRRAKLADAERAAAAAEARVASCREGCAQLERTAALAREQEARWRDWTEQSRHALDMSTAAASTFVGHQRSFSNALGSNLPAAIASADAYLDELRGYLATSNGSGPSGARGIGTGASATITSPAGIGAVNTADIVDDTDGLPPRFEKVSREQVEWALDRLKSVVEPAVRMGKDTAYFEQRDHAEGLSGERSYSGVHRWFYGPDHAIKLSTRADGGMDVRNGYHRIYVARQMGIASLPASIQ